MMVAVGAFQDLKAHPQRLRRLPWIDCLTHQMRGSRVAQGVWRYIPRQLGQITDLLEGVTHIHGGFFAVLDDVLSLRPVDSFPAP